MTMALKAPGKWPHRPSPEGSGRESTGGEPEFAARLSTRASTQPPRRATTRNLILWAAETRQNTYLPKADG